jgi:molybdate transport system substrate-binding protein
MSRRKLVTARPSSRDRNGRLNSLWAMLLAAGAMVAVLVGLLIQGGPGEASSGKVIRMYCAAGMRDAVDRIVHEYEDEYGVNFIIDYDGSGSLLNRIEVNKFDNADLYLAADQFYTDLAVERGLAAETLPVARISLVIAVQKGNPKGIESLEDLLRDDMVVSLPNPDQAAVGRTTRKRLDEAGLWEQIEEHVTRSGVFKPTVNDVATDVTIGTADAAILWDFMASMPKYRNSIDAVPVPELAGDPNLVSVAVLNSTRQPTAALRFARYLTARDRGLPIFEEEGFQPVEGDVWAESPNITFFCGAVNRRAVETVVEEFSRREGVSVNTIYDGCGILTGRMKGIEGQRTDLGFPDIYMACDTYYLENVADWFQEAAHVSSTEIVIAVPKGSEKVKELADLVKPGIRVAVGEPDQCTIGALTRRLMVNEGLYEQLKAKQQESGEVVVEKSSSALLVPDVVTGHVDAAVAYITDIKANRDRVDVVQIDSPLNQARQPLSISRSSDHKHLARRLYDRLTRSPDPFEAAGFRFEYLLDKRNLPDE